MPCPPFVPLAPSAARTAAGNGDALDMASLSKWAAGYSPQLLVQLDVTAVSGTTPSLTLLIEDSIDGGQTWNTILTFVAVTAVTRVVMRNGVRGDAYPAGTGWPFNARRVRARWTITGTTPNFTFSVKGVLA